MLLDFVDYFKGWIQRNRFLSCIQLYEFVVANHVPLSLISSL